MTTAEPAHPEPAERVHLLSDYTWAGRRAACGVTSEFLPSVHSLEEVTCGECLAVTSGDADA